jgi:hypothetical protein
VQLQNRAMALEAFVRCSSCVLRFGMVSASHPGSESKSLGSLTRLVTFCLYAGEVESGARQVVGVVLWGFKFQW